MPSTVKLNMAITVVNVQHSLSADRVLGWSS